MTTDKLSSSDGFTLMEMLVSINLAFIVFVIMISAYLLTYKLILTTTRNIEEKETLISIVQHIDQSLKRSHEFSVTTVSDGTVVFLFDKRDTLSIEAKNLRMSNYLSSGHLDKTILQIKPKDEELLTLLGDDPESKQKIVPRKNEYTNFDLEYVRLYVWKQGKPYVFWFYLDESSVRQFGNVGMGK